MRSDSIQTSQPEATKETEPRRFFAPTRQSSDPGSTSPPTRSHRATSAPESDLHTSSRDDVTTALQTSVSQPALERSPEAVSDVTDDAGQHVQASLLLSSESTLARLAIDPTPSPEEEVERGLIAASRPLTSSMSSCQLQRWSSVTSDTPPPHSTPDIPHERPAFHSTPNPTVTSPAPDVADDTWESQSWRTCSDVTQDGGLQALCAGALLTLTRIMTDWSEDDVNSLIGDVIKPTPLIVMANHSASSVRTAVVLVSTT